MVRRSTRNVALVFVLGVVALTAGCLEDKETLTVHPNGSGKLHIWRRLGDMASGAQLEGAPEDQKKDIVRKGFLAVLGQSEGIVAWSDVSAKVEGKNIVQEATGYFDDVTKVRVANPLSDPPKTSPFTWKKSKDGFTFKWAPQDLGLDDAFNHEQTDEDKKNEAAIRAEMAKLAIERTVVLPGKTASVSADGKDAVALMDLVAKDRDLIAKKKLKKEAAVKECKEKGKKLALELDATCGPAADDAEFAKELEKAKAAYKGSALEKEMKGGN